MSRWSSGALWETATQAEPSLWSSVDAGVGWPDVYIGGVNACALIRRVGWRSGRSWWLSDPEPGSATLELAGPLSSSVLYGVLELGAEVVIGARPGADLWRGTVDDIREVIRPGETASSPDVSVMVTAVDDLSRILSTELYAGVALAAGDLMTRLVDLAGLAGCPAREVRLGPSDPDVDLPTLAAVTLTGSVGSHLAACERASNAIVAQDRDGSWLVLPRTALPTTPDVVDLVGDACPREVQVALASPSRVVNALTVAGTPSERPASIARYGRRAYDVPAGIATTTPPYSAEFLDAVSEPLPSVVAIVPVETRTSRALELSPFGFARLPPSAGSDDLLQLLAVDWTASPGSWELRAALDRTQSSIAPPPAIPPEPPKPPVTTARVTDTFLCDRDAFVVKSGSSNLGNGGSENLLVGLLADGQLCRGLLRFALAWRGKVVTVHSAKLPLTTSTHDCMAPGSSPSLDIYRVTSSWSEGSYATKCAFSGSNGVVYPGPSVTSTGKVTRSMSTSDNVTREATVTTIVAAWASGSSNYGVELRGTSESSSSNRTELWGRGAGTSSRRPRLVVDYTYEL